LRSFKTVLLAAGLLTGVSASAFAQSVASLPPAGADTAQAAATPAVSTAKIHPDPGTNGSWKEEHHQAVQSDNDPGQHPYTTPHFGPAPN